MQGIKKFRKQKVKGKMKAKKLSAILAAISVLTASTAVTALAAESSQTESADEYLVIEGNAVTGITEKGKAEKKIVIPEGITEIDCSLNKCENLETLEIPASVNTINNFSFLGCKALKEVNVAEANESFSSADGVLFNKDKTELLAYPAAKTEDTFTIPETVEVIGVGAFGDCVNLKNIIIPSIISEFVTGSISGNSVLTFSESISDIYYAGSEQLWRTISNIENVVIGENTTVHFNYGKETDSSTDSNLSDNETSSDVETSSDTETSSDSEASSDTETSSDDSTADSTDSETDSNSSNSGAATPDTGVAGLSLTLGVVALAGAAMLISRKTR